MQSRPLMVASDIGGTLTTERDTLPDFCVRVLNELMARNIPVVLVTGYNYRTACGYLKKLDRRVGILASNGAVAARDGRILWEEQIPEKTASELVPLLRDFGHPVFVFKGQGDGFRNYCWDTSGYRSGDGLLRGDEMDDFGYILVVSIRIPNVEAGVTATRIRSLVQNQFQLIHSRGTTHTWLEIAPLRARKDLALRQYCRQNRLSMSEVIYFGDNHNDFDVLKAVGYPVIMDNSVDDLRNHFTLRVPAVAHQGAAHYLNDLYGLEITECG